MINFGKKIGVSIGLAFIIILVGTTQLVKASSGLKVDVFIHNADCVINRVADITLSTSQDFTEFKSVIIPAAEAVTHFQFAEGEIAVGDGIFANVNVGGLHGSGSTTNGPEKQPERIDVNLNCGEKATREASSGLKVTVFVHDADCVINREARITLATSQDFTEFKAVTVPASDFFVNFQFGEGEVRVGDQIVANV